MKKIRWITLLTAFILLSTIQLHADDTDLFVVQVPPDVLIILDMSGSMNYAPKGPPYVSYPNRRIDIARSVLRDLLDDNNDGNVDQKDEKTLNIRLGYMRYWNAYNNDDGNPKTGSIKVLSSIGTPYKDIWDQINLLSEKNPVGGTPLAASLAEAKTHFLNDVNPIDPAIACRKKFVILITDGADTYGCSGNGADPNCANESDNPGMYRRRMLTVQRAKELAEVGIHVFVVGFGGSAPDCLKRSLNWAAKYGGTDNPMETNSGDPKAYDITKYGNPCTTTNTNADPAKYALSGYAFLAEDASALSLAIKTIAKYIQEKSYSYTAPTIPLVRLMVNDVGYISSFIPNETPFWKGNLKAYRLNENGTFPVDSNGNPDNAYLIWDAVEELKKISSSSRKIYAYINGSLKDFIYSNLTNADLAVSSDTDRANLIKYVRGVDVYDFDLDLDKTEDRVWKLGDIFHSHAVIVGSPSSFFQDAGFSGTDGFYDKNKNRTKLILVGANDGMLHAFNATTGTEEWGFIPNSLLKNLNLMNPSAPSHTYYVDSSPRVADVWFYSDPNDKTKTWDEWRTVLISGLRKGGKNYFALDITDTSNPKYLWEFPKPSDAATIAKMGQTWSEPAMGRVKVEQGGELYERWVAFFGGGFDSEEKIDKNAVIGKAFFVIDIKTGEIIWEFSYDKDVAENKYMTHCFPSSPAAVDTNGDGFVDKVYIGDRGGQMWMFNVSFNEVNKKSNSLWTGQRLFEAPGSTSEKHAIYYPPAVAFDRYRNPWVFFGTGDREDPLDKTNPAERFYAVKDDGLGNYPRQEGPDLLNVTDLNSFDPSSKKGWYIILEKTAQRFEKVLAKPVVFNRLVYFTTYTHTGVSPCFVGGDAKLYVVEYLSGGGALTVDDISDLSGTPSQRSKLIGTGIPSNPVISVNSKGKATIIIGETSSQVFSSEIFSPKANKELLYWREVIP